MGTASIRIIEHNDVTIGQAAESIQAGARDFIIKPFDQERVTETVSRILDTVPA